MRTRHSVMPALLLVLAAAVPAAAGQTSQLQREICAASADMGAKVQACSEMLDFGNLDTEAKARTYSSRAGAYTELGRFDLALGDYGRALDLVPFDAVVFHSRGIALNRLGRNADALKDLDRAILLRPDYGIAHETRSRTLVDLAATVAPDRRREALSSALADTNRAMQLLGPDDEGRLLVSRGRIHFFLGRTDAALADFTRALELEPDSLQALSLRGAVYADTGDLERAIIDFTRFLRQQPGTRVVRMARALGYFQTRQYALALADFDRVLAEAPGDLGAAYCRGAARVRTGDVSGRAEIDSIRTQHPDVADAQAAVCAID
jgi:tetratricopeptide (TPR) repeat protein